jgi:hypothetical protein
MYAVLAPDGDDPIAYRLGDKLGAVVGTNVARHAPQDEPVRKNVNDVDCLQPAVDADRDAFTRRNVRPNLYLGGELKVSSVLQINRNVAARGASTRSLTSP